MPTSSPRSNLLAVLVVALAFAAAARRASVSVAAFAPGPPLPRATRPATTAAYLSDVLEEEETVTMRSLEFTVESRPLGLVLEEMEEGGGTFCAAVDDAGPAYAAGMREGDVLAGIAGDESVLSATLEGALSRLEGAALPLDVKVYRLLDDDNLSDLLGDAASGKKTVRMSPRRLPSTRKLLKASTNANFWKDPLMIGSAVLTVAMPLGVFIASTGGS